MNRQVEQGTVAPRALARIVDPDALDRCRGPCGRLRLDIPASWAHEGTQVEVDVPALLACAHCDGGGCDSCQRTGAVRAPECAPDRQLRLCLPRLGEAAVGIRIVKPFADSPIEQLTVELRRAEHASPQVTLLAPGSALADLGETHLPQRHARAVTVVLLLATALLAAAVAWHW